MERLARFHRALTYAPGDGNEVEEVEFQFRSGGWSPLCREGGWGEREGVRMRRNRRDCVRVGREFRTWEFRPVARSRGTKRSAGLNVISRDTPAVSYYPRSRRRRTTEWSSPPFSTPVNPFDLISSYG